MTTKPHQYSSKRFAGGQNKHMHGTATKTGCKPDTVNKGNNKITELRTILQRESQNS